MIVALPATLTSSIGVFASKFVVNELLERAGLTGGHTVQRGARALMYSARKGFSEGERARFATIIDAFYDGCGQVAAGRKRPMVEIEAVARGRVWTGRDALDAGCWSMGLAAFVTQFASLGTARTCRKDAPVLGAIRTPPVARLSRPKNSTRKIADLGSC